MKKISRRSWHARTYLWWYAKKYGYPDSASSVNLCPYVRAVTVWAPARLLFKNSELKYFTWPVLGLLVEYELSRAFGWRRLLFNEMVIFGFLLAMAVTVAAILGTGWLIDLLLARYDSAHDRVCPRVEFDK